MPKITNLEQFTFACPCQWRGETDSGKEVYIRYRWGLLAVRIDKVTVYNEQLGDSYDGLIEERIVKGVLGDLGYT